MNIILMGYRASGKTSIGRKLADQLWKPFVDLDDVVRQRFGGASIAEIWAEHGEPAFREAEAEAASQVCAKGDTVIALGGGTVMHPKARAAIVAADAVRIYLYAPAEVLAQRLAADTAGQTERPALTSQGGGLAEIQAVLAERDPVYREVADHVFDVTHLTVDDALRYLIKQCL